MRDARLTEILSRRGAGKRIAQACGITQSAVCQWDRVPPRHEVAFATVVAEFSERAPIGMLTRNEKTAA